MEITSSFHGDIVIYSYDSMCLESLRIQGGDCVCMGRGSLQAQLVASAAWCTAVSASSAWTCKAQQSLCHCSLAAAWPHHAADISGRMAPTWSPEHHSNCYTCPRSIWPCALQKVLQTYRSWAKAGAGVAYVVIPHRWYSLIDEPVVRCIRV